MNVKTDPVSSLIAALAAKAPEPAQAGQTDRLAEAAELIPGRSETKVEDLLDSPELARFRKAYAAGMLEAQIIDEVFSLIRAALTACGWL